MSQISSEVQGQKAIRKVAEAILGASAAQKSIKNISVEFTESGGLKWGMLFENGIQLGNEVNLPEQDYLRFSVAFELAGMHRRDWPAVVKFLAAGGKGLFLVQLLDLDDDLFEKVEGAMLAIVSRPKTPAALAVLLGQKIGDSAKEVKDVEVE